MIPSCFPLKKRNSYYYQINVKTKQPQNLVYIPILTSYKPKNLNQIMFRTILNKLNPVELTCGFHTTACLNEVRLLTRLRVVDNSEIGMRAMAEGKPPKVICVYNKQRK